jgi:hypothetical protein
LVFEKGTANIAEKDAPEENVDISTPRTFYPIENESIDIFGTEESVVQLEPTRCHLQSTYVGTDELPRLRLPYQTHAPNFVHECLPAG